VVVREALKEELARGAVSAEEAVGVGEKNGVDVVLEGEVELAVGVSESKGLAVSVDVSVAVSVEVGVEVRVRVVV